MSHIPERSTAPAAPFDTPIKHRMSGAIHSQSNIHDRDARHQNFANFAEDMEPLWSDPITAQIFLDEFFPPGAFEGKKLPNLPKNSFNGLFHKKLEKVEKVKKPNKTEQEQEKKKEQEKEKELEKAIYAPLVSFSKLAFIHLIEFVNLSYS
jgi:hypothetical protein